MKKKAKPGASRDRSALYRYVKARLGIGAARGVSIYELACRALNADGIKRPPGQSAKSWALANAAHAHSFVANLPKHVCQPLPQIAAPIPAGMDVVSDSFLSTYEWRRVRMMALKKYGARCQCCGASPADGAVMNVDHIKPRRIFPALALDVDNLQILCAPCNHGKGNWDMTDWREPEPAIDSLPWADESARQWQHLRDIASG